jgi:phosphate-selective porin OprO and OprP
MIRRAAWLLVIATVLHPSLAQSQDQDSTRTPTQAGPAASGEPPAAAQQPQAPPRTMTATWGDGLTIATSDGDYQVRIGTLVRLDSRFAAGGPAQAVTDTFTMRTVRATIQGRIAKYFTFRMVPDFTSTSSSLADAYVDLGLSDAFHLLVGRDKTPIGFEALLQDANVVFMERGLPVNLMPGRDVGLQVYGDLSRGVVSYAAGIFNGTADGATAGNLDTDNSKDLVGRIVVHPFINTSTKPLQRLGIALAGSRGRQEGFLPSFKTSVQQSYFAYATGATADGMHTRLSPQVFYYDKSFGFYAEAVRSRQVVRKADTVATVNNAAWGVAASYILTGEVAGERVRPSRAFDPQKHTWGAVQLTGRYGSLAIDPTAFTLGLAAAGSSQDVRVATAGVIWFLTTNVKYVFNIERSVFDRNRAGARPVEHGMLLRVQLNF